MKESKANAEGFLEVAKAVDNTKRATRQSYAKNNKVVVKKFREW